jgi:flagellar hook-associated protein 3
VRVTNSMMADTVVFNTQRALQRYVSAQTQMSSGRRINKPSDDPSGTLRDLSYRTEISNIEQYQKNINRAQSWVKTYDDAMADMKNVVSSIKEIAVAMANGNYDATARAGSATEVESAIDHFLQLGNTQIENRYMFSGNLTQSKPFERSSNGLSYVGDTGRIDFEVASGLRQQVNVDGSSLLLKQLAPLGEDADLNVGINGATLLTNLHGGDGINATPPTFTVTDTNLNINVTVDLTGAVTVSDALTMINAQLTTGGITNLTATVAASGNAITLDSTPNGLVTGATLLSKLNSGNGAEVTSGKLRVTNGSTVDVQIDLSGSVTLNDVITRFNTQMAAAGVNNVTMSIDPTGTALQVDDTNAVPLGLSIQETDATQTVASDLGILGMVSPTLTGSALNPAVGFDITETTGTIANDLGILGAINADKVGSDLNPRLTLTTPLSLLRNGLGGSLGQLLMWQGEHSVTLDLGNPAYTTVQDMINAFNNSGLDITASINSAGTGIQIVSNDSTRSFTVEEVGSGRTAKDLGLYGSTDMMGTLFVLSNALRNDDQEGTGMLLGNLDSAIQQMLDARSEIGSRGQRLNTLSSRLDDQKLTVTQRLSEIEDADLTDLATQLATHETNYQAALAAAGKIIQPTLMDFLKI